MGKREKQTKSSAGFLIKIDQNLGIVDAIVSVMGVIDDGNDRIHPGAYTKTIQERGARIRPLDLHNTDSVLRVLGKAITIREVDRDELPEKLLEKYPEATGGLLTSTQYLLDTPEGSGAFKRIQAGAIDEYSIGYEALDFDYTTEEIDGAKVRIRNIRTIRLWEYSPVIWGMNEATTTTGVKDNDQEGEIVDEENVVDIDETKNDETKGGVKFVGDVLHASLVLDATWKATSFYSKGVITTEQFNELLLVIIEKLSDLNSAIPEDIANTELTPEEVYYYMSNSKEQEAKDVEQTDDVKQTDDNKEIKAGSQSELSDDQAPTDEGEATVESLLERANLIGETSDNL